MSNTNKHYYGWTIIVVSGIIVFFSGPGQTYSMSMFIDEFVSTLKHSRSTISGVYSIATLFAGLTLPVIGRKLDKLGHRKMVVFIAFMLALASLWMSFVSSLWMLAIGFYLMRLFGQGSMTLSANTLLPKWFKDKRAIAFSLMAVGGVLGSSSIPIINAFLISNFSVGFAWRFWSIALLAMMVFAYKFVVNQPSDINQNIEQENQSTLSINQSIKYRNITFTLKEAMRTLSFWLMLFTVMVPSMINTGITFHMVSIIGEKSFSLGFAAFLLGITALVQFPMTFVAGWILDNFQIHYVRAINFIIFLVAIALLLFAKNQATLIIYALVHGIFVAFESVSSSILWPNYYGLKHLGEIRSVSMVAMVLGSALGPLPFGIAFDFFASYYQILLIMAIFPVLSSMFCMISPAPKKTEI